MPGLPLGTIGGIGFQLHFPLDANTSSRRRRGTRSSAARVVWDWNSRIRSKSRWMARKVCSATVGGTEFNDLNYRSTADAMKAAEARMAGRVPIKAGPHDVTFHIVPPSEGITQEHLQPTIRSSPDAQETLWRPGSQRPHQRSRESHRARRYAEPPEDLHLPPDQLAR